MHFYYCKGCGEVLNYVGEVMYIGTSRGVWHHHACAHLDCASFGHGVRVNARTHEQEPFEIKRTSGTRQT